MCRVGKRASAIYPLRFLKHPSDWDLILPKEFTIVSCGLNVQSHTEAEFNKAIDALGASLGIFAAEECDAIVMGGITLGTQRGYIAEQEVVAKLSRQVGLPVSTAMSETVQAMSCMFSESKFRSKVAASFCGGSSATR